MPICLRVFGTAFRCNRITICRSPGLYRFNSTVKAVIVDDMATFNSTDRLAKLRQLMKERELDVYIVPSEDAHQSEYIAACDARREFICGFTGSAGVAVITAEKAALSTDGRYFNQAEKQLDTNWELLKQGMTDVPTWGEWTADAAEGGKTVGVDPTVITAEIARKLAEKIKKKGAKKLVAVKDNLIDLVWGNDRPSRPMNKIMALDTKFAGKGFEEKLTDLRKELEKKKSPAIVLSMLDEIAWLFNLRGSDIDYNPVFFAYAIITREDATLFIDESKLTPEIKQHLGDNVHMKPYDAVFADLETLNTAFLDQNKDVGASNAPPKKYLISNRSSWALAEGLGGEAHIQEIRSPVGDAKALKNETEMEGMRQCHIRDGAALIEYFAWLENELITKNTKIDEVEAATKLEQIRSKHEHFVGLSFTTISSTGSNAAVIHYSPKPGSCLTVDPKAIYLCDSGAQFYDGTTDTTRTLHFSDPTPAEIEAYTLVLKGHIAVALAKFPKGTSGISLDAFARQFLWDYGLDFRHSVGHGVGSFLNVHEGPIGIGTRLAYADVPLAVGHVISNEPGYYEDGSYGIRIENIVMVKEVETKFKFGDKPYLGFETVTMVPMCKKLTDEKLLSEREKEWLDNYHKEVWEKTHKFFEGDEMTTAWLKRETAPYGSHENTAPRL